MLYDRQDSSSSKQAPGQPQQAWIQLSVKDMLMIKTYDQSGPTVASIINAFYCAQHPVAKVQLDNLVHAPFAGSGGGGGVAKSCNLSDKTKNHARSAYFVYIVLAHNVVSVQNVTKDLHEGANCKFL